MGRAVGVFHLGFSTAFGTVSHSLLLDKLARYRLDGQSARWMGNWLIGHTQRVVVNFTDLQAGSLLQVRSSRDRYWSPLYSTSS